MTNVIKRLAKDFGFDDVYLLPVLEDDSSTNTSLSSARDIMLEAKSVLLLLIRHSPFTTFPKTSMIAHSHYPASQKAYIAHKKLIEKLQTRGIRANSGSMLSLKKYASAAGLTQLRNSLNYHKDYGSYVSLQAIVLDIEPDEYKPIANIDLCKDCDKCVMGCPTSAISMDGGIDREKCLRHHIPIKQMVSDEIKNLSRMSYIGCGVCQQVCPLNDNIEKVEPPCKLVEVLDISRILNNDKEQIKKLGEIIGKNSARPGRVIATACLAAGSTKDAGYLPELEKLVENHTNPLVKEYANWAINQIRM